MSTLVLSCHDVFKIYGGGNSAKSQVVALRSVSMDLLEGEFVAIVGKSGSGKTTLINVLGGLTHPSAGTVSVRGQEISALSSRALSRFRRKHIGLVFQLGNLIPHLSALENVVLPMTLVGRSQARKRARELLAEFGLKDRLNHRPAQLSGGEIQRVSIAVALANEPDILLGDEITGELDSETSGEVMSILKDLNKEKGLTILTVTHNERVAKAAQRSLQIKDGAVLSQEHTDALGDTLYEMDATGRLMLPEDLRTDLGITKFVRIRRIDGKIEVEAATRACPSCGHPTGIEFRFCNKCGTKMA